MRLIDADEFKTYCEDGLLYIFIHKPDHAGIAETLTNAFIKDIDAQPTVERNAAATGRWMPKFRESEMETNHFKCSSCGKSVRLIMATSRCTFKYCPHCGAKMYREG